MHLGHLGIIFNDSLSEPLLPSATEGDLRMPSPTILTLIHGLSGFSKDESALVFLRAV